MDKTVEINETVTFIKATREEAIALAYDMGGGEIHALHVQHGFGMPAERPVGYLVLPLEKKGWVGLTDNEARKFYEKYTNREELIYAIDKFLEEKNNG